MSTLAAPRPVPAVREAAAGGELLPLWFARGGVLIGFIAFAGMHWAGLLEPAEPGRAWEAVGLAVLVVVALLGAARLGRPLRWVVAGLVALAAVALALLAGGLADEYLRPDRWGALLSGAGRGIDALPGIRVPYRGLDEWTRLAIGAGGALLPVIAALLAFWPRRDRTGFPAAALLALVTLYAVPAVVLNFEGEFLRGALLALLMVAFLRLEKLRMRDAPAAGIVAVAAAAGALLAAPALDGADPWFDYESWAVEAAGTKAVAFNWDHDYGPLDWPRDGRELLRVKATRPAYWKARDLSLFDGRSWRQDTRQRGEDPAAQLPASPNSLARWSQHIEVTIRNLRSDSFVTAGIATSVDGEAGYPIGGGVFNAPDGLGRGDSYTAEVYAPSPTRAAAARQRPTRTTRTGCAPTSRSTSPSRGWRRRTTFEERQRAAAGRLAALGRAGPAGGRALRQLRRIRRGRPGEQRHAACVGARPAAEAGFADGVRLRRACRGAARRRVRLLRAAAAGVRDARRLPVRIQGRLLPAVLRRRGAAAADGRGAGSGRDRLLARAPSTNVSASSSCATSTPTRGSRRGSRPTAGSRATRRPRRRRRARSRATTRTAAPRAASPGRRTSAASA